VLLNPLAVLREPTTNLQWLPHIPNATPHHSSSCSNPEPLSTQVTPGQSRALRGHVNKYNRSTVVKNLSTRDWRGAFRVLTEHRRYPLFFSTKKKFRL
jgi:hypothetical protein